MTKTTVKIIHRTIRKNLFFTIGLCLSLILAIVLPLFAPLVLGNIVDAMSDMKPLEMKAVILYMGLLAGSAFADFLKEGLLVVSGQKVISALREALSEKLNHLPVHTLASLEQGEAVSRLGNDVNKVEDLFTGGIISMIIDACKLIALLIMIALKNRGLFIVILCIIPLIYLFTRTVQKSMYKAEKKEREASASTLAMIPQTIHNMRTIHNLQKYSFMQKQYDKRLEKSFDAVEKTSFYDAVYSPVILLMNAVVVIVVMMFGSSSSVKIQVLFGMSAGGAVTLLNWIAQIFSPIESIGMEIQTIQAAVSSVSRIDAFLALQEWNVPVKTADPNVNPCIVLKDVCFGYEESEMVLDHFDMTIEKGEHVYITGRTGCGKSTLFKLLCGLYVPQSGTVQLCGADASSISYTAKKYLLGYVEQKFAMVPGSIKDQITLYDEKITAEEVIKALQVVDLYETVMHMEEGLDTPCKEGLFSKGEWQLLSIARAIVTNPAILLLDEITANLDANTEQRVLKALENAGKDRTVLTISHRLYEVEHARRIEIKKTPC